MLSVFCRGTGFIQAKLSGDVALGSLAIRDHLRKGNWNAKTLTIEQEHSKNTTKIQQKHNQNTAKTTKEHQKYNKNTAKTTQQKRACCGAQGATWG